MKIYFLQTFLNLLVSILTSCNLKISEPTITFSEEIVLILTWCNLNVTKSVFVNSSTPFQSKHNVI